MPPGTAPADLQPDTVMQHRDMGDRKDKNIHSMEEKKVRFKVTYKENKIK